MRHYLVSGFKGVGHASDLGGGHSFVPFAAEAVLESHEVLNKPTLREVEQILLQEAVEAMKQLPDSMRDTIYELRITSFQPFETSAVVQPEPAPAVHLNPADFAALPPVDSPLLIEIAPGVLVLASRPAHAEQKGDDLRFDLPSGGHVVGRFRWTHA